MHICITLYFFKRGRQLWENSAESTSILNGEIMDVFTNIINVRVFGRHQYETSRLKSFQINEIQKSKKALKNTNFLHIGLGLSSFFLNFSILISLIYG
jgi:ABC-type multidrug transport system fused ATPase/permease subunit